MLIDLPPEIIANIARNLNHRDNVEFMRTCHLVNGLVPSSCIYRDITIRSGQDTKEAILKTFMGKENHGRHVKRIKVDFIHSTSNQRSLLATAFPNITSIEDWNGDWEPYFGIPSATILTWKDKIEKHDVCKSGIEMARLMKTTVFSRLVDLTLIIGSNHTLSSLKANEISWIKNAPSLKYLTLKGSDLTIDEFEQVHNNTTQLSSLTIINSIISVPDNYILPQTIPPADKLTTLILDQHTEMFDKNCRLMDYIIAKYPNLIHLEFLMIIHPRFVMRYRNIIDVSKIPTNITSSQPYGKEDLYGDYDFDGNFHSGSICEEDSNVDDSDTDSQYSYDSYGGSHRKFSEPDRREVVSSVQKVYSKGGQNLLSRLPETIKYLKINTAFFGWPTESLKESGIRPTEIVYNSYSHPDESLDIPHDNFEDGYYDERFHIYSGSLISTVERQYLHGLDSIKSLTCRIDDYSLYNSDVISRSITTLKILYYDYRDLPSLKLETIFQAFPAIEDLTILEGSYKILANKDMFNLVYPSLKRLSINFDVKPKASHFICNCLPNLQVLEVKLNGDNHIRGSMYKIDLTGLDVTVFTLLSEYHLERGAKVYVQIIGRKSTRIFHLYGNEPRNTIRNLNFYTVVKEVNRIENEGLGVITVHCDNITTFNFNNFILY